MATARPAGHGLGHQRKHGHEFGLGIRTDYSLAELASMGILAEKHGFDSVALFADLGYRPPIGGLLAIAQATSTLRLGPVGLNPHMLHPVEIAGQTMLLDEWSDGRAFLGLVRGSWLEKVGLTAAGGPELLVEAIEIVERLMTDDRSGYEGRHWRLEPGFGVDGRRSRRRIPLLVGTWGPKTAAAVAGRIDEIKLGGCANADMVALMAQWLKSATANISQRDPPSVVAGAVTVVDTDGKAARRAARFAAAIYLDVVAGLDRTVDLPPGLSEKMHAALDRGDPAEAGRLIPDDVLRRFAFCGTPDEVAAQAAELLDAGAARIEFGSPHGLSAMAGIDLLGRAVLPALM